MAKKTKKYLAVSIGVILLLCLAVLIAIGIIKWTYSRNFVKDCYRVCYYDKEEKIWEYRPWGHNAEYIEEDRDFPLIENCLAYCLSQKQIDFIK